MPVTRVRNKADLVDAPIGRHEHEGMPEISLSAKTGAGVTLLRDYLKGLMAYQGSDEGDFSARRRHLDAIDQARGRAIFRDAVQNPGKLLGGLPEARIVAAGRQCRQRQSVESEKRLVVCRWRLALALLQQRPAIRFRGFHAERGKQARGSLDEDLDLCLPLRAEDWPRLTQALNDLTQTPMYIDDTSSISLLELRSKARRMVQSHGCRMIVIDYMQLINAGARIENRQQEISLISRSLKGLARELDIPVVALAQLSRQVESRDSKKPILSDLRESGALEQDADVVMFIYRDEMYNENTERPNLADIMVAKHRNGPTGTVSLYFRKELAQFLEAEVRRQEVDVY